MTVSWQQPGLLALAEDNSHGDSCGPIIMLDYLHLLNGATLDYPTINALRSRCIAAGYMTAGTGMTMGSIVEAMAAFYGIHALKYVPWNDNPTPVLIELRADIVNALDAHQLVGMETHNAAGLPGNQPGIRNHFILGAGFKWVGGVLYVLVCNGDLLSVLAGGWSNPAQQPVWVSWDDLVRAQISSYAIWPAIEEVIPMLELAQVSGYFQANPDGSWHSIQTGKTLRGGVLNFYRTLQVPTLNGMSVLRLPLTDEIAIGKPKAGSTAQPTFQIFEAGVVAYDPDRMLDTPPGASGPVYFWHLNKAPVLAIIAPPPPAAPTPPAPPNVANYITIAETAIANLVKALGSQAA